MRDSVRVSDSEREMLRTAVRHEQVSTARMQYLYLINVK
jgi:hypothetical protein